MEQPVQRVALSRGEQPAPGPQAVHRPILTDNVLVDPDTALGQGVIEVGQGGGEPVQRPTQRVGQPGPTDRRRVLSARRWCGEGGQRGLEDLLIGRVMAGRTARRCRALVGAVNSSTGCRSRTWLGPPQRTGVSGRGRTILLVVGEEGCAVFRIGGSTWAAVAAVFTAVGEQRSGARDRYPAVTDVADHCWLLRWPPCRGTFSVVPRTGIWWWPRVGGNGRGPTTAERG